MRQTWTMLLGVCVVVLLTGMPEVKGQDYLTPTKWAVTDFPDPNSLNKDNQRGCGRTTRSYVCDPNAIVSKYKADQIDKAVEDVYRNTSCPCGIKCGTDGKGYIIRVVMMPRMKRIFPNSGNSSYMRLRDTEMYSYILTTRWDMDGLCNESLLILFSKYDDILYTLTRQKTATVLGDQAIQRIMISVRSFFDDNDTIGDGILEMIRRYKAILMDQP